MVAVVKQAGEGLQSSYIIDTGSPPGVTAFTYYFPPWDLSFSLDLTGALYAIIVFHYLSKEHGGRWCSFILLE